MARWGSATRFSVSSTLMPLSQSSSGLLAGPGSRAHARGPIENSRGRLRPRLELGAEQPADVRSFPRERALEVAEESLARLEQGRMQHPPPAALARRDHVVEHLVVHDVRDEV